MASAYVLLDIVRHINTIFIHSSKVCQRKVTTTGITAKFSAGEYTIATVTTAATVAWGGSITNAIHCMISTIYLYAQASGSPYVESQEILLHSDALYVILS